MKVIPVGEVLLDPLERMEAPYVDDKRHYLIVCACLPRPVELPW